MENSKTSIGANGLVWFGAGVSIAEILTGTLIAPLGFTKGFFAILIGHLIGCILLYLAGLIGANTQKSSMETVKNSFGQKGSLLFSLLNVLQLIGWTAVMIVSGSASADSVLKIGGTWVWCLIIGGLIAIWILIGLKNLNKINAIAMASLYLLTIILSTVIFKNTSSTTLSGSISFGSAIELSVAMPLSWLPLISDYTRMAAKPKKATVVSALTYFFVSCWMYVIGMGAAIFTRESDIAKIMLRTGLGVVALIIIVFSTVTTTFLDVYSAGVSSESISKRCKEKPIALLVCIIGTLLAIFTPITQFEGFLYLIGSVFAPMIAILIVDFYILHKDSSNHSYNGLNLFLWVIGFIIYRFFMTIDTPIGNTLPVMFITSGICIIANKIISQKNIEKAV